MLTFLTCGRGYKGQVARPIPRLVAIFLSAGTATLAAFAAAGTGSAVPPGPTSPSPEAWYMDAGPEVALRPARLARAVPAWRGGPITTSTGETVNVRVSDALPVATATPESWAEFIVSLTHGPELSLLTAYVATLAEVQETCGDRALGCYGANQMIVPGEIASDGTTPEDVVRHEYGHHVAFNRANPPWVAVEWGPKNWASAVDVCARVSRGEAFPGDEGANYAKNPGEAWAETYRLLDERRVGITTATWPIIAQSFYPTDAAYQAAERDVVEPWSAPRTSVVTRVFPKKAKRPWLIPLQTPLDGELRVGATLPAGSEAAVVLVGANRTTVVRRAQWVSQRVKRLTASVCGQRQLFVRVTPSGAGGRVRVSVTTP